MHDLSYLRNIVIILAAGVTVVTVFHRLKIPAIAGFIMAGMLIGPHALGLIGDPHQTEMLAEIGVALLLFSIGLELSLSKLKRVWRLVVLGGFMQVAITAAVAWLIGRATGLAQPQAVLAGLVVAVSSTAIVLRGLQQRGEIDAPHGKFALGILVFQDLAVVPIMLAIPLLAGDDGGSVWKTLVQAALIIVVVMVAARLLIPPLLQQVARTRQRQLFILAVFVVAVGTAWVISSAGASLAVGAFLAGLVVADSAFREQAVADIISFKEVFSSLFFVSVGMVLSPAALIDGAATISWMLAAVLVGKFVIISLVGVAMRLPLRVSLLAGVALCQVGEFALVIMRSAAPRGILPLELETNLTAVAILSMLITPFALAFGPLLAAGAQRIKPLARMMEVESAADVESIAKAPRDHIVIGGFGFTGRELARALDSCGMPYVVAELNAETVRSSRAAGVPAVYADITSPEVLSHLGLTQARQFVIAVNDPSATERAIRAARTIAPNLNIIARTNYLLDIDILEQAGADVVIPAEREAAVEVVRQVLHRCEVCEDDIARLSQHVERREYRD